MRKKNIIKIISVLLCFFILLGYPKICVTAITQPNATGDTVTVKFLFAFFRSDANLSFSTIKGIFLRGREVKVLGYSGSFVYVQDLESEDKGYIHELLLNDKPLNIKQQYVDVYSGAKKDGAIAVNYNKNGALEWSVSPTGIVEVTEYSDGSLSVKGLNPGTATLTVKCNGNKDTCDIACIKKWSDTETATAQTSIKVMGIPGKEYKGAKTIPEGATITARGNIPSNSDYVYVSSGDIWGFINLSDFSTIKYMMTQYHYYDQGFNIRFGSASTKISDYASVLNDKMIELFGLKICPYIYSYTSVTDQCKIWRYGSVYSSNLSSSCPKNGNHKTDSCLKTGYLREELKNSFGNGGGTVSKVAWTGHIMSDHDNDRSNSTVGVGTIIITPYKTVQKTSSGYVNDSNYEIRRDSISTLMHETIHQLGVHDHYCYDDQGGPDGKRCSNTGGCYVCYGNGVEPDCMMMINKYPTEDSVLLCNKCKSQVFEYLSNNF